MIDFYINKLKDKVGSKMKFRDHEMCFSSFFEFDKIR